MQKKLASCFILILLLFSLTSVAAPTVLAAETREFGFDVDVSAKAAFFMSLDSGDVIFAKNPDEQVHPASTTKIMAAALAMTLCDDLDNTIVTIPVDVWRGFEGMGDVSNAGLLAGEEVTMRELLYCMLLQSANEAAVAVADYYGYDTFIQKMNEKAAELGCTNTHFSNPHGAFADNHYTSARDLAIITQWALKVPGFWDITQQSRYQMRATNKKDAVTLATTILMQDENDRYYVPYIKGIKSGTLDEAGRCLVSAAQQGGSTYLLVILGAPYENLNTVWADGTSSYTDTKLCYDWAFANLKLTNVIDQTKAITDVKLRYAANRDTLLLYPGSDLFALTRKDDETEQEVRYAFEDVPKQVKAPIADGDKIGTAKVYYGDRYLGDVALVSREDIPADRFVMVMDVISEILTSTAAIVIYAILLIVIILYLYYALVVVPKARKRQQKLRQQRLQAQRRQQQQSNPRGRR